LLRIATIGDSPETIETQGSYEVRHCPPQWLFLLRPVLA